MSYSHRNTAYVFGNYAPTMQGNSDVTLCVVRPTRKGWMCRSTLRDALNHDYPRRESLETIMLDWIEHDLTRTYMTFDRREVIDLLASSVDPEAPSNPAGFHLNSFLRGNPSLPASERAERVLRHLECGW